MITTEFVGNVFALFEQGQGVAFVENHVAEYVDFRIMGHDFQTAGHYNSRTEAISVMNRIVNCLNPPVKRKLQMFWFPEIGLLSTQVKQP